MLEALREDFQKLPELLEAARPQPEAEPEPEPSRDRAAVRPRAVAASQLGLFG